MRRRYIALILLTIVTAAGCTSSKSAPATAMSSPSSITPHALNLSWSGHHDHLTLRYAPS
jgi:hypothetical protein